MPEMLEKRAIDEIHCGIQQTKRQCVWQKRQLSYSHRLHYRWSQLEADRCSFCLGTPAHPLPTPSRTIEVTGQKFKRWSRTDYEGPAEKARLAASMNEYYTKDYNTFCKNGVLKLTEVELYFLSSMITRSTAHEWAVVYLGIGSGDRFRWLRDEFYPGLCVIGFDPLDTDFFGSTEGIMKSVNQWNKDGTGFTFVVRCADAESDPAWIRERTQGRKLLLISDIRGVAKIDETIFDKVGDQELQWRFIQALRPVKSLVKFTSPDYHQVFEYPPGVILKQIFTYYGSMEVRLIIDGVPETTRKYNAWDLYNKMTFHHEHVRGQVYENLRNTNYAACFDNCFDCAILWDTVFSYSWRYAKQNDVDPHVMFKAIHRYQVYTPTEDSWCWNRQFPKVKRFLEEDCRSAQWTDALNAVQHGNMTQAIAALEATGDDSDPFDLEEFTTCVREWQPDLIIRVQQEFQQPTAQRTKGALIKLLGSLSKPFTLLRTELNGLLSDGSDCDSNDGTIDPQSC